MTLPADSPLAETLNRVLDLCDDPEACIKGTEMIPIHRNSLRQIRTALLSARASTIEECARAAEALAHGFNMGRLFTRDPATACEDCAATLRALASADPSPDPLMRKEPE